MKFEKIGSISYKKGILVGVILAFLLVVVINLFTSLAKYRLTESVKIVESTVSYSPYDFKIMEIYKQKEGSNCTETDGNCYDKLTSSERMPGEGYVLNETNSHCDLSDDGEDEGATLTSNESGETVISGLTVRDKCYLYYDKEITASEKTLAGLGKSESEGCPTSFRNIEDKQSLICKTEDDFGDSYYFRGKVEDNWVKFGNMSKNGNPIYWRIIRINGDGSIRLIYSGNGTSGTNLSESDGRINGIDYKYNNSYSLNSYVGYEYNDRLMHGYGDGATKSNALTQLMLWFGTNLTDEWDNGKGQIDVNSGFCNDRSGSTNQFESWSEIMKDSGGISAAKTYYGADLRLVYNSPTLKCSTTYDNGDGIINKNKDYFTYTGATGIKSISNVNITGTKSLQYPVGLITADESVYAGGAYSKDNYSYWLYTGKNYWTMSPAFYYDNDTSVWAIFSSGSAGRTTLFSSYGLRPVINLKSSTEFSGKGIKSDPYVVKN